MAEAERMRLRCGTSARTPVLSAGGLGLPLPSQSTKTFFGVPSRVVLSCKKKEDQARSLSRPQGACRRCGSRSRSRGRIHISNIQAGGSYPRLRGPALNRCGRFGRSSAGSCSSTSSSPSSFSEGNITRFTMFEGKVLLKTSPLHIVNVEDRGISPLRLVVSSFFLYLYLSLYLSRAREG